MYSFLNKVSRPVRWVSTFSKIMALSEFGGEYHIVVVEVISIMRKVFLPATQEGLQERKGKYKDYISTKTVMLGKS